MVHSSIDDAALVEMVLGGDREAFARLVRRHQGSVFNVSYRWTKSADEAADVTQDTFIRAFQKLGTYDPAYPFRNWVLAISSNLVKNRFRSEKRRQRAQEIHLELYPAESDAPTAELEEAVAALPESLRVPLVLKHVEGLSYEEVAGVLGLGLSAAKMRVKRARDMLVALLEEEDGTSDGRENQTNP